jgi:hypothetical protein
MSFHNTYGLSSPGEVPMNGSDRGEDRDPRYDDARHAEQREANRSGGSIEASVPPARQQELLDRLLGTRVRDEASVETAHRDLIAAAPELHRRLLVWLHRHEPESPHLAIGLAVLATAADPAGRQFAARMTERLSVPTLAALVDYVHGWHVDRTLLKRERLRFQDEMTRAYAATAGLVRESLAAGAVGATEEFVGGEILVTLGEYDRVQQVLDYLQLPYRVLPCQVVAGLPLRADQVLIVNCPGRFDAGELEAIRRFVARGGTLVTTDWALETTVQRAFPGTIQWTGQSTADDVVQVSWVNPDSPYTRGVELPGRTISWWLEGASYPIRILDRRVNVLVRSREMGHKYREDPLVVTFDYGEGTVFHLTSHYYLQRSQGDKSAKAAGDASTTPGKDRIGEWITAQAEAGGLESGQVSAAYSSMRLLANILYESRRKCGV